MMNKKKTTMKKNKKKKMMKKKKKKKKKIEEKEEEKEEEDNDEEEEQEEEDRRRRRRKKTSGTHGRVWNQITQVAVVVLSLFRHHVLHPVIHQVAPHLFAVLVRDSSVTQALQLLFLKTQFRKSHQYGDCC